MASKEILLGENYILSQATLSDAASYSDLLAQRSIPPGSVKYRDAQELSLVIADKNNYVCVIKDITTGRLCAGACLEVYEEPDPEKGLLGLAEERSVAAVVDGMGFGKAAALGALVRARDLSIGSVYATTDNISYFAHLGFEERRGGNQILWMDLKNKQTASVDLNGIVRPAEPKDREHIYRMMQNSPDFFPMGEKEFVHRYGSFWVFAGETGEVLGSVCPIVYANRIGQRPRMAEVRALSVDHNHLNRGVGMALLAKCQEIFMACDVIQAFTTAYPGRADELIDSRFFNFMPGNKSVLWWNRQL